MIGLGRALGLASTAEGVETSGQLGILRAEGCDEVQGFYIGRPVAWDEIERTLRAAARASRPRRQRRPPEPWATRGSGPPPRQNAAR